MKLKKRIEALESWQAVAGTATSRSSQPDPQENTPSEESDSPNRIDIIMSSPESVTPIPATKVTTVAIQQPISPSNTSTKTLKGDGHRTVQQIPHGEHPSMDWSAPSFGDLTVEEFTDNIGFAGDDNGASDSVWGTPKPAQADNIVLALNLQSSPDKYESVPRAEPACLPSFLDQASDEVRAQEVLIPPSIYQQVFLGDNEYFIPQAAPNDSQSGKTSLHLAAEAGRQTSVSLLLERLSSIGEQDQFGRTALHLAVQNRHERVVQTLVARQSGLDVQNHDGQTALHIASSSGHDRIVELLLQAKVRVELKDSLGRTALHLAVLGGCDRILELLLNYKADINARVG